MARFLKPIAVGLNILGLIVALMFGIAGSQADTSPRENIEAALMACVLATMNTANLFMLLVDWKFSAACRGFVIANNGLLMVWAGRFWWDLFVMYGKLRPPFETILLFGIAATSIGAIIVRAAKSQGD